MWVRGRQCEGERVCWSMCMRVGKRQCEGERV